MRIMKACRKELLSTLIQEISLTAIPFYCIESSGFIENVISDLISKAFLTIDESDRNYVLYCP